MGLDLHPHKRLGFSCIFHLDKSDTTSRRPFIRRQSKVPSNIAKFMDKNRIFVMFHYESCEDI